MKEFHNIFERILQTSQLYDSVASAGDVHWQGGAYSLPSNYNVFIFDGTAAPLHDDRPITVYDCQVVVATGRIMINVERVES